MSETFDILKQLETKYLFLVVITYILAIILSSIIRKLMSIILKKHSSHLKVDPTNYNFLKNAVTFIILMFATLLIFYIIPEFRQLSTTLFAGAGVFAAILAFASQAAFSNIVSGVFIVIFKPFRVGDMIAINNNVQGYVKDITLRHTVINDFENKMIIIPNAQISVDTIVNYHINDEKICRHIYFNVALDSNIDQCFEIIKDEVMKHKFYRDIRSEIEIKDNKEALRIFVREITDYSIRIRANVWSDNPEESWLLYTDVLKSVKERFDNEGIKIATPIRTIDFKESSDNFKIQN